MSGESVWVDPAGLPWRESPYPGVTWKKLRHDTSTGESAVLLRFEPGASYGTHRHPGGEQYAGRSYGAGSYVCHAPGSVHRPRSRDGCVVFVTLPRPIEDLEKR